MFRIFFAGHPKPPEPVIMSGSGSCVYIAVIVQLTETETEIAK
jgi:hypothetical protein